MVAMTSWGRLSADEHNVAPLTDRCHAAAVLASSDSGIAYGMGRSYGDICLNPHGTLWPTHGLDHYLDFDAETGRLICEAGVLLRDIQQMCVPRGWMLAVTPGTQLITVGGAIANDVHGKNHHCHGSFGDHICSLDLLRTDGEQIRCGPDHASEWFAATVGGMGLTGVILSAEIQLRRVDGPWLESETLPYTNLQDFFQLADDSESHWEHTVSWIDCLSSEGRGLFMRANPLAGDCGHALPPAKQISMPIVPPFSLVNQLSLRPFNFAYFHLKKRQTERAITHYQPFSYPLDNVQHWNRMYGPKGFFQYQCVVPREAGHDAISAMLAEIKRSGDGSFLAVLKTFGNRQALGMMSFPQPGVTLALDFPNRGARTTALFERLDAIVRTAHGRIYPAKDARMPRDLFEAGYPRLSEFLAYRDRKISSALSRRLMGY
jgi:FAD/FMN-containing dehydrogenase